MKKSNKKTNKQKLVKELAEQFKSELDTKLPVAVLPNGNMVYKDFLVKPMQNGNWGVFHVRTKELVEQYFLKTCALMGAKAYNNTQMTKFNEIKELDNKYWAHYCDSVIFKNNIKSASEFDRYIVLLNRLEESTCRAQFYKEEISRMFKWSFV
jgi:hypothetical protein